MTANVVTANVVTENVSAECVITAGAVGHFAALGIMMMRYGDRGRLTGHH